LTIASRNSGPDGFLLSQALVGFHPSVESIDKRRIFDGVNDQDGSFRISRWLGVVCMERTPVARLVDNVFEEQLGLPTMCPLCPSQNLWQRRLAKFAAPEKLNLITKSLPRA
jgi:hypothetical protein